MKTLYESILDDEDEVMDRISPSIIEQFLKDNYKLNNCSYTIKNGVVNVERVIKVKNLNITSLTNGLFEFGEVEDFHCNDCEKLESLKGAPKKCNVFDCSNTGIKDLQGSPEEVGEYFTCDDCEKLESLKGSPKKVEYYSCLGSNIKDLTGITQQIGDTLDCRYCEKLESLKGAPKKIPGCLLIDDCPKLTSLKYCPKEIGEYISYSKTIKGIRNEVKNNNIKVKQVVKRVATGVIVHNFK